MNTVKEVIEYIMRKRDLRKLFFKAVYRMDIQDIYIMKGESVDTMFSTLYVDVYNNSIVKTLNATCDRSRHCFKALGSLDVSQFFRVTKEALDEAEYRGNRNYFLEKNKKFLHFIESNLNFLRYLFEEAFIKQDIRYLSFSDVRNIYYDPYHTASNVLLMLRRLTPPNTELHALQGDIDLEVITRDDWEIVRKNLSLSGIGEDVNEQLDLDKAIQKARIASETIDSYRLKLFKLLSSDQDKLNQYVRNIKSIDKALSELLENIENNLELLR